MAQLKSERIREIESFTQALIEEETPLEKTVLPIAVDKIAERYGISVVLVNDFPGVEGYSNELISGRFRSEEKKIEIAADDYYGRQAFTVAHELGHYFLKHNKKEEVLLRTDALAVGEKHDPMEAEANWFAASLLMPKQLVLKNWVKTQDMEALSRLFGVSPAAMKVRLMALGLLNENYNG